MECFEITFCYHVCIIYTTSDFIRCIVFYNHAGVCFIVSGETYVYICKQGRA
jgi:hypothetical protein